MPPADDTDDRLTHRLAAQLAVAVCTHDRPGGDGDEHLADTTADDGPWTCRAVGARIRWALVTPDDGRDPNREPERRSGL